MSTISELHKFPYLTFLICGLNCFAFKPNHYSNKKRKQVSFFDLLWKQHLLTEEIAKEKNYCVVFKTRSLHFPFSHATNSRAVTTPNDCLFCQIYVWWDLCFHLPQLKKEMIKPFRMFRIKCLVTNSILVLIKVV